MTETILRFGEPEGGEVDGVELSSVILVTTRRGKGVEGDPIRFVRQVWSVGGKFIAEWDPVAHPGKGVAPSADRQT